MQATRTREADTTALNGLFKTVKRIDQLPAAVPVVTVDPAEVERLLREGEALAKTNELFEQESAAARGNVALYELLGKLYDYGLRIETSALKDEVIDHLRQGIKSRAGKAPDPSTPLMTLVVKYVVKADNRQTIHNYSRALRVAQSYRVATGGFPAFVKAREGIHNLTQTKDEKEKSDKRRKKAQLLRQELRQALATAELIAWPKGVAVVGPDDEESPKGEFTLVVARNDGTGLRLGAAFRLPKLVEDTLMNSFTTALRDDKVDEPQKT